IEENRHWRSRSVVLAIAGLCHPVAFLNAAAPGVFFLFDREHFARNVRYLALVYGGAVLLMGFWLIPLVAKLGFATSINWKWHFASWQDLMPKIFWPAAAVAALDVLWMAVFRRPTDRPGRYLLFGAVRGKITDARVAYENSPIHDRFGSMRVFEDLPLLAGRPTLEGVLLQTAVTSPPIYWLQSQISKQGSGVIPGYSYPSMDLPRATPRLMLFNVSDMITVTPEVTTQLEQDARWQRIFHQYPYSVFHLKNAENHYVRVPRYRPVAIETARWKRDFVRWFSTDSALDVPIVDAASIPAADRNLFPRTSASAIELPRERLPEGCRIENEQLDHMAIEFTTTCPGLPHIVAVSYYPNWHVEGARRVFLVRPAFMLVVPDGPYVRLVFRRIAADWPGIAATLADL